MWRVWGKRHAYRGFIEKREGKRPFGVSRCRWQYNTNMDLKQVKEIIYCISVAQNKNSLRALVKQVMNYRVPKNARDF
jgi:hypothetical protein